MNHAKELLGVAIFLLICTGFLGCIEIGFHHRDPFYVWTCCGFVAIGILTQLAATLIYIRNK